MARSDLRRKYGRSSAAYDAVATSRLAPNETTSKVLNRNGSASPFTTAPK